MKYYLHELPNDNLPRERLAKLGASSLSDYELLAIILRTGTKNESVIEMSKKLLAEFKHISNLNNTTISELMEIKGIGSTKAIELLAAIELGRRVNSLNIAKVTIMSSQDIVNYLKYRMQSLTQEQLIAIYLNVKSEIIDTKVLTIGTANQTIIDPKEVMKWALKLSSSHVVIAHNHPSGDPTPSRQDIASTDYLISFAKSLDITIVDHIIIGQNKYFSFSKRRIFNA